MLSILSKQNKKCQQHSIDASTIALLFNRSRSFTLLMITFTDMLFYAEKYIILHFLFYNSEARKSPQHLCKLQHSVP